MTEVGEKKCRICKTQPCAPRSTVCYRLRCRRKVDPMWDEPSSFKYAGDQERERECPECGDYFRTCDFSQRYCSSRCRSYAHERVGDKVSGTLSRQERARLAVILKGMDRRKKHKRADGKGEVVPHNFHGFEVPKNGRNTRQAARRQAHRARLVSGERQACSVAENEA